MWYYCIIVCVPPILTDNKQANTLSTVQQRSFDPYQPLVTSIDAQPSADERGESITDTQLKNLKALKNTIQDRSIERNVTVLLVGKINKKT